MLVPSHNPNISSWLFFALSDCLLPTAYPGQICTCGTFDVAVSAGRAIILVSINGRNIRLNLCRCTDRVCNRHYLSSLCLICSQAAMIFASRCYHASSALSSGLRRSETSLEAATGLEPCKPRHCSTRMSFTLLRQWRHQRRGCLDKPSQQCWTRGQSSLEE